MYSDCFQVDMAPDIESCHSGRKQTSPVDKEMCKQVVFINFYTCTIPALEKLAINFFFQVSVHLNSILAVRTRP